MLGREYPPMAEAGHRCGGPSEPSHPCLRWSPGQAPADSRPGCGEAPRTRSELGSRATSAFSSLLGIGRQASSCRTQVQVPSVSRREPRTALPHRLGELGGELATDFSSISTRARPADGSGVEPLLHAHDRNAGRRIPCENGPLDRSRSPPARQERGVDVDAAVGRDLENLARENQPVGGYNDDIGGGLANSA